MSKTQLFNLLIVLTAGFELSLAAAPAEFRESANFNRYAGDGWYQKHFDVPKSWSGKRQSDGKTLDVGCALN
jgi:hypothetical protein